MAYYLGVDLGTTYTAAAVWREHKVEIASLGNRAAVIPSLILLREDEEILTGEAADRRGATEPDRLAREFKRRLGDPAPIVIGGTPYSAASLMGRLLRWVVDKVTESEGSAPTGVAVSHPANWGPYKADLLAQAIQVADLDGVTTLTEPEAAAIHYATQARVADGSVIGVYDLGGGTFDAAVLRKVGSGFEILGEPQGIERLGGVDFDEAVYQYVMRTVGDQVEALDPDDPTARAAVARLRTECTEAKEALSADTDATIPVILPGFQTEIRLTRDEFEHLVRPALNDSITSVNRALRSANIGPEDLTTVLLVGGSSRIPLVGQMVGTALGRPVAVDAHPKHGIALGAAIVSAQRGGAVDHTTIVDAPAEELTDEPPPASAASLSAAAAATAALASAAATFESPSIETPLAPTVAEPAPGQPAAPAAPPPLPSPASPVPAPPASPAPLVDERPPPSPEPAPLPKDDPPRRRPLPALIGGAVAALVVLIGGFVLLNGGDDPEVVARESSTTDTTGTTTSETTVVPPSGPFVTLNSVQVEGGRFRVGYEVANFAPKIDGGPGSLHIHLFLNTTLPQNAGNNGDPVGVWEITDEPTSFLMTVGPDQPSVLAGEATQVCGIVATVDHNVFDSNQVSTLQEAEGIVPAGTCIDLPV